MLSRTADHLFWMSRYLERAENLARLLDLTQRIPLLHQIVAPAFRSSPKWCSTVLIAVRRRCPFLSFQFFV